MAFTTWSTTDLSSVTLDATDLIATSTASGGVRSADVQTTGKFYWECTFTTLANVNTGLGIANNAAVLSTVATSNTHAATVYKSGNIWLNNGFSGSSLGARTSGDIIGTALDVDAQLVWFRVAPSGNWNGSATADPATGTGGLSLTTVSSRAYALYAMAGMGASGDVVTANFGASAFSGSVPSGFTSGFVSGTPVPNNLIATQIGTEAWVSNSSAAAFSQIGTEAWVSNSSAAAFSQIGTEVWRSVADALPSTNLVVSYTPGADRNDFIGYVGYSFVPSANITVRQLGMHKTTGNTGSQTVYLVDGAGTIFASASVDLTAGNVGNFYYTTVPAATLISGTTYYLLLQVTSGGQFWSDLGPTTLNGAGSVTARFGGSLTSTTAWTANSQYVGLDLTSDIIPAPGALLFTGFAPTTVTGPKPAAYTPPVGNAANFSFIISGYTPPAGSTANFNFQLPTTNPGTGSIAFTGFAPTEQLPVGTIAGSSTASAFGAARFVATATGGGTGVAAGAGGRMQRVPATATGSSAAAGHGAARINTIGTATGSSSSHVVGTGLRFSFGTATGSSTIVTDGRQGHVASATTSGQATVTANSRFGHQGAATASGNASASALTIEFSSGRGIITASATVTAFGRPLNSGAATAHGSISYTVVGNAHSGSPATATGHETVAAISNAHSTSNALAAGVASIISAHGLTSYLTKAVATGSTIVIGTPSDGEFATGFATGASTAPAVGKQADLMVGQVIVETVADAMAAVLTGSMVIESTAKSPRILPGVGQLFNETVAAVDNVAIDAVMVISETTAKQPQLAMHVVQTLPESVASDPNPPSHASQHIAETIADNPQSPVISDHTIVETIADDLHPPVNAADTLSETIGDAPHPPVNADLMIIETVGDAPHPSVASPQTINEIVGLPPHPPTQAGLVCIEVITRHGVPITSTYDGLVVVIT